MRVDRGEDSWCSLDQCASPRISTGQGEARPSHRRGMIHEDALGIALDRLRSQLANGGRNMLSSDADVPSVSVLRCGPREGRAVYIAEARVLHAKGGRGQ